VLVFVHGFPEFWFSWHHQIDFFAKEGYRVIVPDLRGFGRTSAPNSADQYSLKIIANDLAGLLDHLGVKQAVFIGHDWGGAAVWRMALWHPDRVRAVAAVCTPYRPRSPTLVTLEEQVERYPVFYYQLYFSKEGGVPANKELTKNVPRTIACFFRKANERIGKWMTPDCKELFENYPENPERGTLLTAEEFDTYVQEFSRTGYRGGLFWYAQTTNNWNDEAALPSFEIKAPALMVTAGKDIVLRPELTTGMEKWIPNLSRGHIEEASHWVQHEKSDELNTILKGWLGGLPRHSL
jgi:soluble epoxide hydrolase/lipid-phosphate phosphatase